MALNLGRSRARSLLVVGALTSVLGVGLTGTAAPTPGGLFLVAGWFALAAGIHRFGREGSG